MVDNTVGWFHSIALGKVKELKLFVGAPASQVVLGVKNPPADAGDIRWVGFFGWGNGHPLQYSCWRNPGLGAWRPPVRRRRGHTRVNLSREWGSCRAGRQGACATTLEGPTRASRCPFLLPRAPSVWRNWKLEWSGGFAMTEGKGQLKPQRGESVWKPGMRNESFLWCSGRWEAKKSVKTLCLARMEQWSMRLMF